MDWARDQFRQVRAASAPHVFHRRIADALGIGANTAIFSLLNAVLLRELPVPHPDQLVLFGTGAWGGSVDDLPDRSWNLFFYSGYREFQATNQVYSNVAAICSILFGTHGRVGSATSLEDMGVQLVSGAYFPGVSPVGRTFTVDDRPSWQDITIVGVVRDAKYINLEEKPKPAAYYPYTQHGGFFDAFVVRYSGDPKPLIPRIRGAIAAVDRNLPVSNFSILSEVVDDSIRTKRLVAKLSVFFGALAALLACIGIYGVMSYGIARRTNEFGIRMALGAQRGDVLWMVLRGTLALVLVGVAAGIAIALQLGRLVGSMLFGLAPSDPLTIALATALMIAVALLAVWLPARRATRIDPTVALRYE